MMPDETSESPRRRWQFTLRAALLAVLPVALALGLWQARRQWQAAHFIRIEASGGRLRAPGGKLDCDLVIKLRCSRTFTCEIEHLARRAGFGEISEGVTVCQARPIGARASERYGVELRVVYRDGTVSIFSDAMGEGVPAYCRDLRGSVQELQVVNVDTRTQGVSFVPFDTPVHVLSCGANYDDPQGSGSGSASDDLVIQCMSAR